MVAESNQRVVSPLDRCATLIADGWSVRNQSVPTVDEAGRRLDGILSLLLETYVRMILDVGVFQADPHPGNLLVTEDDRLVVLDFGACGVLRHPGAGRSAQRTQ